MACGLKDVQSNNIKPGPDVVKRTWWCHHMDPISHYWLFVRESTHHRVDSLHKGLVMRFFGDYFDVSMNKLLNKQ